jgi:hypothetical protein
MSKATVQALSDSLFPDIGTDITPADLRTFNDALIADYQEEIQQLTQAEIDALTPDLGQIVFNEDLANYCFWNGSSWKYFVTNGVNLAEIRTVKVTVTSAEILDSHDNPVELLPAPGVNSFYQIINTTIKKSFDTTAYDTNVDGNFTIGSEIVGSTLDLSFTQTSYVFGTGSGSIDDIENQACFFTTETGNPENGDGELVFYITYQILEL